MSKQIAELTVTCDKTAKFGERQLVGKMEIGTAKNLQELAADVKALGIDESQVCAKFWAQLKTDAQNVMRPFLRTEASMEDTKDATGAVVKGARSKAVESLAKFIAATKKPVGEGRELSPEAAAKRESQNQGKAISAFSDALKARDPKAMLVQAAILQSKAGLSCITEVAKVFASAGADAALELAKKS